MRLAGLVVAGGLGSRMGAPGPKALLPIGGRTCLDRALACLRPACDPVLLSTNDPAPFEGFGLGSVADRRPERLGPLAGLEAAWHRLYQADGAITHLIALPGDTPFLPLDLVARLSHGADDEAAARVACRGGCMHPTVALWRLPVLAKLSEHIERPNADLSLMAFLRVTGFEPVEFPADPSAPDGDPFFNLNTPDDLTAARRHA